MSPVELIVSMNLSIYNLSHLQLLFPESVICSKSKDTCFHAVMCHIAFRLRTDSGDGTLYVTLAP